MVDPTPLRPKAPTGGNGSNGSNDVRERLSALETEMRHLSTKADLESMKNSLIMWMMGTMAVSVLTLIVAVIRTMIE